MGRKEMVELTNMCMVEDGRGNVLVQNRLDPNWSGIVYPGGHVDAGESITASVIREIREETGLTIEHQTVESFEGLVHVFETPECSEVYYKDGETHFA